MTAEKQQQGRTGTQPIKTVQEGEKKYGSRTRNNVLHKGETVARIGCKVEGAPASADALRLAGLDWQVVQQPIYTDRMEPIPNYKANVRDSDCKVPGVVTDRYKIIQYHYP